MLSELNTSPPPHTPPTPPFSCFNPTHLPLLSCSPLSDLRSPLPLLPPPPPLWSEMCERVCEFLSVSPAVSPPVGQHLSMHFDAFHHQVSDLPPALPARSLRKVPFSSSSSSSSCLLSVWMKFVCPLVCVCVCMHSQISAHYCLCVFLCVHDFVLLNEASVFTAESATPAGNNFTVYPPTVTTKTKYFLFSCKPSCPVPKLISNI